MKKLIFGLFKASAQKYSMKIKQLLLSAIFIIGIVNLAFSSHIVGGEMTYTYLGEDQNQAGNHLYTITMNVFRDCFGSTQANFDSATGADKSPTCSKAALY